MPREVEAPTLTIDDALEVLENLATERLEQLILVGGQAAAFWIARYKIAQPKLVATKDIDVFLAESKPAIALDCAKDLGGELVVIREPRAPDVARVRVKTNGAELQIDFLRSLHGVSESDVIASKLPTGEVGRSRGLFVMHPVFMLASRLLNTFELRERLTEENLLRLEFSIRAVRAYLTDEFSTVETANAEVSNIERIFDVAVSRSGIKAWRDHKIDVFSAVPEESELSKCPQLFLEKRYPQMIRSLARKRARTKK